jgi:hypothetical protein
VRSHTVRSGRRPWAVPVLAVSAVLGPLSSRPSAARAEVAAARATAPVVARAFQPLIVNGQTTSAYPAVGVLLLYTDATAATLDGACSGTLIGCRTFLTAAHCVCGNNARNAASCGAAGMVAPDRMRVFLQQAGMVRVAGVAVSPDYSFSVSGDVAVVTLAEPVTGIAPTAVNMTHRPEAGTAGTIVGFGTTANVQGSTNDSGIKRAGPVTTGVCPSNIPSDAYVCWEFAGSGANSCEGDSGGPLLVDFGDGPVVAGVTSGGRNSACLSPDSSFDADVFVNRSWISTVAGTDLRTESCDLPAVGTALTSTFSSDGTLASSGAEARLQFEVPDGTALLRIGLNAQFGSGSAFASELNDFDLYARAGSDATVQAFDCADTNPSSFGFCEVAAPRAGTWHVLVRLNQGAGAFQVTATTFAAASPLACTGDCNDDGAVTVDEMVTGVAIALGDADPSACRALDANGDGVVTIDELVAAVTNVLDGCRT